MTGVINLAGKALRQALIALMLTCFSNAARAAVRMVDDNKAQCPSAAYTTLADAVTAASDGDSIVMCAGTYTGGMAIFKSLSFAAYAGTASSAVIVSNSLGYIFWINASNVSFTGFTIASNGSGIDINSGSNFTFTDMNISAALGSGINGYGGSGTWGFSGTKVTANGTGVYLGNGSSASFKDTTIDSSASGFSDALLIGSLSGKLTIENTNLKAAGGSGLSLTGSALSVTVDGSSITTYTSAFNRGIYIASAAGGVEIANSTLNVSGSGIQVNYASDMHITGVDITGGAGDGIYANYLTGNAEISDSEIAVSGFAAKGINLISTAAGSHKLNNLTIDAADGANGIAMQNGSSMSISGVCVNQSATAIDMGGGGFGTISIQSSLLSHGSGWTQNGLSAGGNGSKSFSNNCFLGTPTNQHATNWGSVGKWSGNYWEGVSGSYSNSGGWVSDTSPRSSCPVTSCYASPPAGGTIHHVRLLHDGQGLTCTPETVTVQACLDAGCSSLFAGTATVGLAPTGWVGGDTVTFSGGSAVVSLSHTSPGAITLGTVAVSPVPLAATDCYVGASASCGMTFADAGFLFDVPDHRSEVAQTVNVSAVKKSDGSLACTPAFANVSKSVTFTCAYQNPATGSLPVRVGGSALNASNNAASACDGSGRAVSLSFNASGVASTTVQYADAGALALSASYASASGSSAGLSMTGSDSFVAAPSSFSFSGTTAGPLIAGKTFATTVTALNASGNATPNFGRESSPEAVTLSASRYRPIGSGAVDGAFSGSLGSFSGGSASASNLSWSEVGTIDLTASLSDSNYLGSGLNITGSTSGGAVGRFRPDHFVTTVTPGCGGFTYSAQPMTVIVRAYNGAASPVFTQNYDGTADTSPNYAKDLTLSAVGGSGGSLSPTAFAATVFDSGSATLTTPTYIFSSAATAPATVQVRATDSDGVSSSGFAEGSSEFRSGRLWLGNGYGSELLDLSLPAQVQYYADATTGWAANSADHCTVLAASQFGLGFPASSSNHLAACETALSLSGASPDFFLRFSAPGAGNDGFASVTANLGSSGTGTRCTAVGGAGGTAGAASQAWLRYGWGGGAAIDPVAQAVFGIYRSGVIDWRESP